MSTFRGTFESWKNTGGQLRCTMTNDRCPKYQGTLWREERKMGDEYTSRLLHAHVCYACEKVFVEKKEFVEP